MSDIYPETALKLLNHVLRNAESCFENYAPDGGYAEGVGAWEKSYKALVLMIAMLKKACGTDYGFLASPGFAASALYPIRTETANGMWNFHNSAALPAETSVLSFITNETGNPIPAWMRRQSILSGAKAVQPWDIVFYQPVDDTFSPSLPLDAVYRKAGLALFRSGWGSGDVFFGLHGGSNHETNGDLDAGSFLLEMGGTRFFAETGGIAELPLTLRRRAIGQNTVIVNPVGGTAPDQAPEAIAPLTEVRCSAERAYAVVDMTSTNPDIARAKRGILLCENRTVAVIQDEIVLKKPGTILWNAYTPADVTITGAGKVAKLTVGDKTLVCRLGGIGKGGFETEEVAGCDLKRLYVTVEAGERARISVACKLLAEGEDAKTSFYTTSSIASWGNQ